MPNVKIFGVPLNPGPFTVKEHVLTTIMATVGYQSAYAVRLAVYRFAQISYLWCCQDRYCCSPEGVLQPDLQFQLSVDGGHVYSAGELI